MIIFLEENLPSGVLSFRAVNMLEGEKEAREGEREEESEIEKRMSYGMSLVWLLLSSSVQWSLPPWESAVWTKPLMERANRAAADKAHPTSRKLSLINRRRKRRRTQSSQSGAGEEKNVRKKEEGRCKREWY